MIWLGLFAVVVAVLVWGSPMLLSLVPQTHLTVHLSPAQSVYALNQQVTVSGTLTCSGMCPNAALAYGGMDVHLSGSWGWNAIAETNAGGVYSAQVNVPSSPNSYQISAIFYQNGNPSASATVSFSVNTNAVVTTTTTSQTNTTPQTSVIQTQVTTTTQIQTSTGTTTSEEYSTTTVTTGGSTTTTPNLSGAQDWLASTTTILGYDVPNLMIVGAAVVVLIILWRRRS